MSLNIPQNASTADIIGAIRNAELNSSVSCYVEQQYLLIKIVLIKLKRTDLSVELLSEEGQLLKQARAMRKGDTPTLSSAAKDSDPERLKQTQAVKALEDAFRLCRDSKLVVVGFSDGLVALPTDIPLTLGALSSTDAIDINALDVYKGFENDDDFDESVA